MMPSSKLNRPPRNASRSARAGTSIPHCSRANMLSATFYKSGAGSAAKSSGRTVKPVSSEETARTTVRSRAVRDFQQRAAELTSQDEEDMLGRVKVKEAEISYLKYLPQIRRIAYSTLRRFHPRNASASTNICTSRFLPRRLVADKGDLDIFTFQRHGWTQESEEGTTEPRSPERQHKRANTVTSQRRPTATATTTTAASPFRILCLGTSAVSPASREAITSCGNRTCKPRPHKSMDDAGFFRASQNLNYRAATSCVKSRRRRYCKKIDGLITRCKEAEEEGVGETR